MLLGGVVQGRSSWEEAVGEAASAGAPVTSWFRNLHRGFVAATAEPAPGAAGGPARPWTQTPLVVMWDFFDAWRLVVGDPPAFLAVALL